MNYWNSIGDSDLVSFQVYYCLSDGGGSAFRAVKRACQVELRATVEALDQGGATGLEPYLGIMRRSDRTIWIDG